MTTKKTRVLLIEPSPFLRYAFGRLIRLKGYEVREVGDVAEAIESLDDFQADLILSNISASDKDGQKLFGAMRTKLGRASVPVVPITGDHQEVAARRPVDLPGLLERLRSTVPAGAL